MSAGIEWVDEPEFSKLEDAMEIGKPQPVPIEVLLEGRYGDTCCVRLNCAERGLPTPEVRCPRCEHPTRPLGDYRFPRTVFG